MSTDEQATAPRLRPMTGSCPVSAHVCRETARERDELRRWKTEALPVLDGLQELGKALGLPLGSRITGQEALAAVERLRAIEGGVKALAESFEEDVDWSSGRGDYGDNAAYEACARRARALLNPTEGENHE